MFEFVASVDIVPHIAFLISRNLSTEIEMVRISKDHFFLLPSKVAEYCENSAKIMKFIG